MFCKELNVACFELQNAVSQDFRVLKNVEVERSHHVGVLAWVPLKSDDSKLESIHAQAIVRQLLVAVFNLVKPVYLILEPHVEPWELGIDTDEVCSSDWLENKG